MTLRLHFCRAATAALIALSFATHAQEPAASWPSKPVRIIVPFPAGGTADLMPRFVAERLAAKWGQAFIVENRAGAAGNIGAEAVYKSDPDGYTLLSAPPPPLVINQSLYAKLAFDATQFVPVSVMGEVPNVFLMHPKVGANNVREAIAYIKANPGKLNYASQGSGTTSHLTAEMFKTMAGGLTITHVPYKGTAPALADLLGGQVEIMFDNLGVSLQHVRTGKVKALAVASNKRIAALPDVATMAESLPGFESVAWFGVVAPPKTSPAIAEKLSAAIAEALRTPEMKKRLVELSAEPVGNTPTEMAAYMRADTERWRNVIRAANVKAE
ncbi:MAG: Bug family tripartite tricarboxylate transporter substrate binding protein [Burkholderiales bacterium]